MAYNSQNNILITQDGQACLGEFWITGAFRDLYFNTHELGTLQYMAPECFSPEIWSPKESDVYSLAMTSFSVSSHVVNHLTTRYNRHVMIRSSRGYYRTVVGAVQRSIWTSELVRGHLAERIQVRINGCRTPFGT